MAKSSAKLQLVLYQPNVGLAKGRLLDSGLLAISVSGDLLSMYLLSFSLPPLSCIFPPLPLLHLFKRF